MSETNVGIWTFNNSIHIVNILLRWVWPCSVLLCYIWISSFWINVKHLSLTLNNMKKPHLLGLSCTRELNGLAVKGTGKIREGIWKSSTSPKPRKPTSPHPSSLSSFHRKKRKNQPPWEFSSIPQTVAMASCQHWIVFAFNTYMYISRQQLAILTIWNCLEVMK